MNILVTGANGQLGRCLSNSTINSKDNYIYTDIKELDLTNATSVKEMIQKNDISVVINCAAYTNVDGAENDKDIAEKINAQAVENIAIPLKENNGTLIHISTDYVFGGSGYNTPIGEERSTHPTGIYGLSKLHGEQLLINSGCKFIIFRTAWLYSEYGKNFVKTMLGLTNANSTLKVVFDQIGSPTYAQDLADAIYQIVEKRDYIGKEGIYHFTNEGVCSWFDFTKTIAKMANHTNCDIQPCFSKEFPSAVVRPAYSVLDKTKYKKTFRDNIPYWQDSLAICINNLITK